MTQVVGILNITPDSFFDGGKYYQVKPALDRLKNMIDAGADVIDVGAESTRPNATPINASEENKRLEDTLPQIIKYVSNYNQENHCNVEVSLDSRHYQTVAWGLGLGIDIINDVSGFCDARMVDLAVKSGKKIVVMHNLGIPSDKNKIIDKKLDIVEVLIEWMKNKLLKLQESGVKKRQIIFDIGIGFGKNSYQSIQLLQKIESFLTLDLPLYVGHSNKSFLDYLWPDNNHPAGFIYQDLSDRVDHLSREEKTNIVSKYLKQKGVEYLRQHIV